jgi:hypothetical protein
MDLASCIFLVVREVRITWKRKKILLRIFYSTMKIHFFRGFMPKTAPSPCGDIGIKKRKIGKDPDPDPTLIIGTYLVNKKPYQPFDKKFTCYEINTKCKTRFISLLLKMRSDGN